jgi:mono/diheme cytochrome c family protein
VLAVFLFIAFWVILAIALFFVAVRGGVGGARETLQTQSRSGRRVAGIVFVVIYAAFGVAIPLLMLTGNHANASSQIGGIKLTADEKTGRELFGQNCAVCHTLAAANANGKVGPNLDQLKPPKSLVLNTINNGCLQAAAPGSAQACLGIGNMPSAIVEGKQADQIAAFVAKVAGNE